MARTSCVSSIVVIGAALAAAGCSSRADVPMVASQEEMLTPERARSALLDMMRSKAGKDLGWFDRDVPDKMSELPIEKADDGWYEWTAAFRIHPTRAVYAFIVQPRPGARACIFEYRGTFVRSDGHWLASPPELVRSALQGGG